MSKQNNGSSDHLNNQLEEMWNEIEEEAAHDLCVQYEHEPSNLSRNEFNQLTKQMERYVVAAPTDQQIQALLSQLRPIVTSSIESENTLVSERSVKNDLQLQNQGIWTRFGLLLLQQVHLFSWMFWVISAIVIITGALIMPIMSQEHVNPFLFLTPLVSGIGVFYALRSYRTPMGELEATFPVSPSEIMIGRIGIILIYDIGLALIASFYLYSFGLTGGLIPFIIGWLVPLCFCTLLSLVTILRFGAIMGVILSLGVWGMQLMMREFLGPFYFVSNLGYEYWVASRLIGLVFSLLLLVYAFQVILTNNKGATSHADTA